VDEELVREARRIDDTVELDLPPPGRKIVIDVPALAVVKVLAILFVVYLVIQVWQLILFLLISAMLASALAPFLALIERTGLPRPLALTVLALSLLGGLGAVIALVVPPLIFQTRDLLAHSDAYIASLQAELARHGVHAHLLRAWHDVPKHLETLNPALMNAVFAVFDSAVAIATVLFLTLYILSDQDRLRHFFVGLFPVQRRVQVLVILAELRRQVGGYVRGQLITSLLAGIFSFVVMTLAGVPNAVSLAVFVAVTDLIPMFGNLIGTIPPVLIAVTISPVRGLLVLAGFVLYQNLENHLIVPRVYANTMSVSSLVALVGILMGAKLLGFLGMLIALPLVAATPVILDFVGVHLKVGEPPQPEADAEMDLVPQDGRGGPS
jgi:predicted PurR-regulated permease PerM